MTVFNRPVIPGYAVASLLISTGGLLNGYGSVYLETFRCQLIE